MSTPTFDRWVADYLKLRKTQRELAVFIREKYDTHLQAIARAYALAREPDLALPCDECGVMVSTLVDDAGDLGWYFEWTCRAGGYGCSANTCGWRVPMDVIRHELPSVL